MLVKSKYKNSISNFIFKKNKEFLFPHKTNKRIKKNKYYKGKIK